MSTFIVLGGINLVGEEIGGVYNAEGVALGNKTLESPLIKDVNQSLVENHLTQFLIDGLGIGWCHLLDAD